MPPLSRRPQALFLLFVLLFAAVLGAAWLRQGPTAGELFLPLAKAADFEAGCRSVHGVAWWTPSYLGGHSLATAASTAVDFLLLEAGRLLFSPWAGDIGAYKIVGLLALAAAGLAMYRFVAALTNCTMTAAWAGIFYAACPELSIRLARAEHLVTALCFPFLPLVLHRFLRLRREGAERRAANVLAAALLVSAMLLTWSKVGFLSLPPVAFFIAWLAWEEPGERRPFLLDCGKVFLLVGALAGFPLLPLLREQRWMNLFAFDPLADWQRGFALKTAFSWWDRHGLVLGQARADVSVAGDAFYIGLVWGPVLLAALAGLGPLRGWLETAEGRLCRFFCALTLFFAWISYGLRSAWSAHRDVLAGAATMPHWSIALLWLALVLQVAAVVKAASGWTARRWVPWAAAAVYLFVPGFRLFELIPLYGELRAPASIWSIDGSACLAVAGALALAAFLRRALPPRWLAAGAAGALALLLLDFSAYHAEFGRGGLPPGTYDDFRAAADFMRRDPAAGGVFAVSGRYFYLQVPQLSGRPLCTEAATSYFQMRWTRELMEAGWQSEQAFDRVLAAGGVAFILVDKTDPSFSPDFGASLRRRYPAVYENGHFAVLRDAAAIAPALAAGRVEGVPRDTAPATMLATIFDDRWSVTAGEHGTWAAPAPQDQPSGQVPLLQPRAADYQTIRVAAAPPGRSWIILPESYHPDWMAEVDGRPVPVYRALGCYLAAATPRAGAAITFRFHPPRWYAAALALGLFSWIAVGGLAAAEALRSRRARTPSAP